LRLAFHTGSLALHSTAFFYARVCIMQGDVTRIRSKLFTSTTSQLKFLGGHI
jgi:hypothetical protein